MYENVKLVKAISRSLSAVSFFPLPFFFFLCFLHSFYLFISPFPPPQSCPFLLPFQTVVSLCCQPMFSLSFWLSRLISPLRALGMQVLSLLSLCGSLSDCMKMNFYGLLIDCPLLYISSLSAIMSWLPTVTTLVFSNPFSERSSFLPHQF